MRTAVVKASQVKSGDKVRFLDKGQVKVLQVRTVAIRRRKGRLDVILGVRNGPRVSVIADGLVITEVDG